jgi:hypothetical protein
VLGWQRGYVRQKPAFLLLLLLSLVAVLLLGQPEQPP